MFRAVEYSRACTKWCIDTYYKILPIYNKYTVFTLFNTHIFFSKQDNGISHKEIPSNEHINY